MKKSEYQVTGWTYWNDQKYEKADVLSADDWQEARQVVIEEIKAKGYKICGYNHQNQMITPCKGVPIINDRYRFENDCLTL